MPAENVTDLLDGTERGVYHGSIALVSVSMIRPLLSSAMVGT